MSARLFNPNEKKVLTALINNGMLIGIDLEEKAEFDSPRDLLNVLQPLIDEGWVSAGGSYLDEGTVRRRHFGCVPSKADEIEYLVRLS